MPVETWPPPPTTQAPWHRQRLRSKSDPGTHWFEVRWVPLWGTDVLIDRDHNVYCSDCWTFLPVEQLGRRDNTHRAGLTFGSPGGVKLLPLPDDDDDRGPSAEEGF